MAKLVILAAFLASMVVMTHATIQTTVITTEVDETGSNQMRGGCSRQLRGMWPDQCEMYMMEEMMSGRGRFELNEGMHFDQCCKQLRMMQPAGCQCEAMQMMTKEMMMHRGGSRMGQRMMDMAMRLPMKCGTMQEECSMSRYA